jgi:hypothetical protein
VNLFEILSVFVSGLIAIAALSLIVNPNGRFPQVVTSFGDAISNDIKAAKAF